MRLAFGVASRPRAIAEASDRPHARLSAWPACAPAARDPAKIQGRIFKARGRKIQILDGGRKIQAWGSGFQAFFFRESGLFKGLRANSSGTPRSSPAPALRPRPSRGAWPPSWAASRSRRATTRFSLGEQPLARRLIVDRIGPGRALVAVELSENLEIERNRADVAFGDPLRREPKRVLEAGALQHRMIRSDVDLLALQRLADDLAHAARRHPLLERDILVSPAQAQARENALPPQRLPVGVEPRPADRRTSRGVTQITASRASSTR